MRSIKTLSWASLGNLLVVGSSFGAPMNPGPPEPRPAMLRCQQGFATFKTGSAQDGVLSFVVQAWPASRANTFQLSTVDWDGSIKLTRGNIELKGGGGVLESEVPNTVAVLPLKGRAPKKLTLILFGIDGCKQSIEWSTPAAANGRPS